MGARIAGTNPATDGGAAVPLAQTGSPVESTPARSRTTPSLTLFVSTTATHPAGICSIAARFDLGEFHEAGVAKSLMGAGIAGTNPILSANNKSFQVNNLQSAHG